MERDQNIQLAYRPRRGAGTEKTTEEKLQDAVRQIVGLTEAISILSTQENTAYEELKGQIRDMENKYEAAQVELEEEKMMRHGDRQRLEEQISHLEDSTVDGYPYPINGHGLMSSRRDGIRAYANLSGLGQACFREMRATTRDLRPFAREFTAVYPLFDFIDVGPGPERADDKIWNLAMFYLNNKQCMHVLLGICHDGGYAPYLEGLTTDETTCDRITLVIGAQFSRPFRELNFAVTRFPSVFSLFRGTLRWAMGKRTVDWEGINEHSEAVWQRFYLERTGREDPTARSLAQIAASGEEWRNQVPELQEDSE
ncbi:MAG: hypothetical protein Q9209_006208 [Squamulea sp. 1 TL-2023]